MSPKVVAFQREIDGEPFEPQEAERLVRQVLKDGDLIVSGHAAEEMRKDALQTPDVVNVLRAGWATEPEKERGTWRYRFQTNRMVVVVAFRSRTRAVIVTAWRIV